MNIISRRMDKGMNELGKYSISAGSIHGILEVQVTSKENGIGADWCKVAFQ